VRTRDDEQRYYAGHRLGPFLLIAIVTHGLGFGWLFPHLMRPAEAKLPVSQRVRLVTVDGNVVHPYRSKPREIVRQNVTPPHTTALPPPEAPPRGGQVVALPATPDAQAPDHARFLAETNSRVEHETRSRFQSASAANVTNEPAVTAQPQASPRPASVSAERYRRYSDAPPAPRSQPEQQPFTLSPPNLARRQQLALAFDAAGGRFRNQTAREVKSGSRAPSLSLEPSAASPAEAATSATQTPTLADLIPSMGQLAALPGAPSNDYLEGLEVGDGTFLNAREFKYASFFNRVKRAVSEHWSPMTATGRGTDNRMGAQTWVTVVNVTLDGQGSVSDVAIAHASGNDALDREAVAAFVRAGAFPNPPKGLVAANGTLTFAFGFHISPTERSSSRFRFDAPTWDTAERLPL